MRFFKLSIIKVNLILVFFLIFKISTAQIATEDLNFVSINEDLTQRAIISIFKDSEDYLWIATYGDGIFRYNSTDFKHYKQDWNTKQNSLNSSIIHATFQDKEHNIWIATERGLNKYNRDLDRFENIDTYRNEKKESLVVQSIADYNNTTLLLGTNEQGLFKLDKNSFKIELIPHIENDLESGLVITSIVKSPNGRFLIGTNNGLMTFDPYTELLQLAKLNTQDGFETISSSIQSLYVAKDNSVWVGTSSSGLIRIFENKEGESSIETLAISNKRIMSISEKSDGEILCSTENDGLFTIKHNPRSITNYKHNKFKQDGLKSNSIWSLFVDSDDRIYVGYYEDGVDVYDSKHNKFNAIKSIPTQKNSLNSFSVTGIFSDDNERLWISMSNGGIDVYDPVKNTFTNLSEPGNKIANGLKSLNIPTIFIDSKHNIWAGSWDSGIFLLKKDKKKFVNFNTTTHNAVLKTNRIMSFAEDSYGIIWIGTFSNGLYSYDPISESLIHHNSAEFLKHNLTSSTIRKILVDNQDNIWLGSRSGLFKIKNNSNRNYRVTSFNDKINVALGEQDIPNIVFSLYEDNIKNIWIGTFGNGLFRYNINTDTIEWFNINNGLNHETISSISQDVTGALWIAGNAGLSKLDFTENPFTNYSKKDGLLSNNFNYNAVYKSKDNILYFGNSKGINYFNPNEINYNQEKPKVYLTELKISNQVATPFSEDSPLQNVISKTDKITLNHDQSAFTISYVGVNYTRSENNQYAYFLDGFDDEWNYVESSRNASFKNVPPGKYIFKVKASNNDGVWNDIPTTLNIEILSAWWATNVAIVSYILFALLLSILIYRIVSQRIEVRRLLNLERQEHKQFEALNAKKIQFFTNISHEFRTPLTLILTPLEDIIEKNEVGFSNEIKEKHTIIYKNAKRLSRLINELMDFRKLQFNKMSINASQINVVPFIQEVTSHYEEEAIQKNIVLSVEYEDSDLTIWSDPSMLEKIIFNLLSNAFKATPVGGLITIQINKPNNSILFPLIDGKLSFPAIEIIIKDTGLGIKEDNLDKVFNRFYQADEMNEEYYGGTGIGLELVKSFVDLHKGKIELSSEVNVGTQFKIYFPLGYTHLKEENLNIKPKKINLYSESKPENYIEIEENTTKKEVLNKKMVLIVEDNIELRSYLKNELKNEYIVHVAENGLEGLEKADKYIPDLIITDVMMPIMDGFEFCERIKNDLKTSHIPLLMVTAKGLQIDKVRGIDSGADVYLNKPFNMKVLRSHLNQLITSRQILFDKYFNGSNNTIDSDNTTSLDKEFINNVLIFINEHISDEKLNVENLARKMLLSRSKLYRKIKALTGDTANEFIRKVRLKKAKQLVENTDFTISEIGYKVGFSSPSYFTKCFKEHFKMLPNDLRSEKDENS